MRLRPSEISSANCLKVAPARPIGTIFAIAARPDPRSANREDQVCLLIGRLAALHMRQQSDGSANPRLWQISYPKAIKRPIWAGKATLRPIWSARTGVCHVGLFRRYYALEDVGRVDVHRPAQLDEYFHCRLVLSTLDVAHIFPRNIGPRGKLFLRHSGGNAGFT
jgi:hypothetical protein